MYGSPRAADRSLLAASLVAALACLAVPRVQAQEGVAWHGVVFGVVKDSTGARVPAVSVVALRLGIQTVTDDSGAFRLTGLPAGTVTLQLRRLGYVPAGIVVTLVAAEARELGVVLAQTAETLDAIDVQASVLRGKMSGFNSRRGRGVGTFITRDEIERRQPSKVSQLLRYVAGVYVPQDNSDMRPSSVGMRRAAGLSSQGSCGAQLYVDGQHYPDGRLDDFRPTEVEGIEIYKSASEIPAAFRSRDTMCGVIAIWTRDPDAVRRR